MKMTYCGSFEQRGSLYAGAFFDDDVGADDHVRPNPAIGTDFGGRIDQHVADDPMPLIQDLSRTVEENDKEQTDDYFVQRSERHAA